MIYYFLKFPFDKITVHSEFKRYFANTSWLFAEKILRMTIGLFVGIWVARYLGPDKLGLLSYAQSFVGIFVAITTLGLDTIVVRELVRDENKRNHLLGTAFGLRFIAAFFLLMILGIAVQFANNDNFTNILIFIIASGIIFKSFNVIDFYFQSKVLSKYVVLANVVSLFVSSIVKIILILNEAELIFFAIVILFDSLILSMGFIYIYSKQGISILNWKFDKIYAQKLLQESFPIIFSILSIAVIFNFDKIVLKIYTSNETVGNYSVMFSLTTIFNFIVALLSNSLAPLIIRSKDRPYHKSLINSIYTLLTYTSLFLISIFLFMGEKIVDVLYGEEYKIAANYIGYYSIIILFIFYISMRKKIMVINGKSKIVLLYSIITTLTMVSLCLILAPIYGLTGVMIAVALSWLTNIFIAPFFVGRVKEDVFPFVLSFNITNLQKIRGILHDNNR